MSIGAGAASLIHTSPDGTSDAKIADNVRVYLLSGLQHFSAPFPPQKSNPGSPDSNAQQRYNSNPVCSGYWRALITDMDQWVKDGTAPAREHVSENCGRYARATD